MTKQEISVSKQILKKVFGIESTPTESTETIDGNPTLVVKLHINGEITSDILLELSKENYENKLLVNYSFKRSGTGIRLMVY